MTPLEMEIISFVFQNKASLVALESDGGLWQSIKGLILYTEISGILLGKSCDKMHSVL